MNPFSISSLPDQLALIGKAPVVAIAAVILVCSVVWGLFVFIYKNRLDAKDAEISSLKTHIDLYKDKLSGASPDEAKRRMDALEDAVSRLKTELGEFKDTDFVAEFERTLENRPMDGGTF